MENTLLNGILKRRSIRKFTGDPVDREVLVKAIQAAMAAPSAMNGQPWNFLVITEADRVREVCRAHPYAAFGEHAGAVILLFGNKAGARWFDQDMAAATQNLLLAVSSMGLGATWCGMPEELQADVRRVVTLPSDAAIFALIPIGVPAEAKPPHTHYDESRVHWERVQF